MVQLMNGQLELFLGDVFEVSFLRKVMPYQAVGVFVESALPRMIGVGEVHRSLQVSCHGGVPCKLFAIVKRDGVAMVLVWIEKPVDGGSDTIGMLAVKAFGKGEARDPVDQGDHHALLILADDGVAFPVAKPYFLSHDVGPLVNADAVLDGTTALVATGIALALGLLAAQVPNQITAAFLVGIDALVDRFMADLQWRALL